MVLPLEVEKAGDPARVGASDEVDDAGERSGMSKKGQSGKRDSIFRITPIFGVN